MITMSKKDSQSSNASAATAADSRGEPLPHSEAPPTPEVGAHQVPQSQSPVTTPTVKRHRKWFLMAGIAIAAVAAGYFLVPQLKTALNTVSTDDAYVNGNVTYVAPRVSGTVMKVLVDDNQRVKKGDVLVQLDKEPYEVQVALQRAAVRVAEVNVVAAEAKSPRP